MAPVKPSSSNMRIKKVNNRTGTRSAPRNHPIAVVDQYQPAQNKQNEWRRCNGRLGRLEKKFTAEELKTTSLADFVSGKLNKQFGEHGLTVRELFSKEVSYFETEEGKDAKKLFEKRNIEAKDYSYRYRMLAVFQMQDEEDVLFFIMSVKEYLAHKWCTVDYLDSVSYFRSKNKDIKKTDVYDEIIYCYFEYSRMMGFERIHIFVCAIEDNKEYFFHHRPRVMETPTQERLMSWYKRLLNNGKDRIVGCVDTQRPTNGRRPRTRTVEDFVFEISYSEFYRLAMEEELKSEEFSLQNFERTIENYSENYENRLLFVNYKPKKNENVEIEEEETIDHKLTKSRCNWLKTLERNNLSFASIIEAKKSTAVILKMLAVN